MTDLITEYKNSCCWLTLNRVEKSNAFDDHLINQLIKAIDEAVDNPEVRAIVLKANGKHFSAGADLAWMQRMALYSEEENFTDACELAQLMYRLHHSPKPCIAMIQGAAFGGGAGMAAACDIAIAADNAIFCFSEVKLGLIPAVISPYVIKAIGERASKALFITAETFNAEQAKQLGLVQHTVELDSLESFTEKYVEAIIKNAPIAVCEARRLVDKVANRQIDKELIEETALLIARKRVSEEGQDCLQAFLNKKQK